LTLRSKGFRIVPSKYERPRIGQDKGHRRPLRHHLKTSSGYLKGNKGFGSRGRLISQAFPYIEQDTNTTSVVLHIFHSLDLSASIEWPTNSFPFDLGGDKDVRYEKELKWMKRRKRDTMPSV